MQQIKLAGLNCVHVPGHPDSMHLIILHGYGANCMDLAPLARELQLPPDINWYFPDGILELMIGPGVTGRAWFPIDTMALQAAIANGSYRELTQIRPGGLDEAREKIEGLIQAIQVPLDRLILGGFSQGAMLSTETALHLRQNPLGLILLSGTLLDKANWSTQAAARKGTRYFQSHGQQDPLLDPGAARELNQIIKTAGWEGQLLEFQGGHELPYQVLLQLREFILERHAELSQRNQ
ncbi:MAG: esterase [Leptospiraceae bacterium]|nr:esterase [Leptospiraceae bacterium]